MEERDLISGEPNRCEAGRYLGRQYVLLKGCPTDLALEAVKGAIKLNRRGEPEAVRGEGWQIHTKYW
jgi:hypothetical protein